MSQEEYTVLTNPDMHDGQLFGLEMDSDNCLTLSCSHVDGTRCEIVVPHIRRLRATNYLEGNIIFEIRIYAAHQCSTALVQRVLNTSNQASIAHELTTIIKDDCIAFVLDSSYGCELAAIASCRPEDIVFQPS